MIIQIIKIIQVQMIIIVIFIEMVTEDIIIIIK